MDKNKDGTFLDILKGNESIKTDVFILFDNKSLFMAAGAVLFTLVLKKLFKL